MEVDAKNFVGGLLFCIVVGVSSFTDPNDLKILVDFRDNLENPELLKWPDAGSNGDPCGPPSWPHVFCSNGRVTQIQVQNLGLQGSLPQNLNQLEQLQNVGLQKNKFCGNLPSFNGLSNLQYAYLDFNEFDTIPNDFFNGLSSIRVLALDQNPFNHTYGWTIPSDLAESSQLVNFSCFSCNLVGPVPDFFGNLPSLSSLILSYNRLSGPIPSTFRNSMLQTLLLNNQDGNGLNGPIEVIVSMLGLSQVWLHGNQFTGMIPAGIGQLTNLRDLNLNTNQLVGMIPQSLASMNIQMLDLSNNMLMGPIPEFKSAHVSLSSNSFCVSTAGAQCAPQVSALLEFLEDLDYPVRLANQWTGNDPCRGPWWGITCDPYGEVSVINLQKLDLNGTLSPSLVNLSSLIAIHLEGNNLSGRVPESLTQLRSLRLLKLSGNNIEPPMPMFSDHVEVDVDGNPRFQAVAPEESRQPAASPPLPQPPSLFPHAPTKNPSPDHDTHHSISTDDSSSNQQQNQPSSTRNRLLVIVSSAAGSTVSSVVVVFFLVYCLRKGKQKKAAAHAPAVVHPKDSSSDHSVMLKIPVADVSRTGSVSSAINSRSLENPHAIDAGNLFISLQVLRNVTNNFAPEHELGRGGFGVVYKGRLEDGKNVAVKRMVVGVICDKALDEFQSEITVLSKVRHRNLVSLLGYSVEGTERLLVYEYMPQGALSRHLFRWKSLGLAPLSWAARLNIALDVARGVEYLHNLARQSFIHRDLKSSNILLDDDFRAKVSDFGLVKLAPDAERSVATRLAGTFGYLAPEYAVTGKITTKVDVFSFGVILIELLTGLVALDEQRPEEIRYLAEWFWQIKSNRDTLIASIDPALDASNEIDETTFSVAELAGHCTSRDPNHRPEMGHAVNVLSRLVEKWKPYEGTDAHTGIDTSLPLSQMLKGWKEEQDTQDFSSRTLDDSKGSIPGKPAGFADSFTSADAR